MDILEPTLADKVREQFANPERRQMIFELLGSQFQRKYFRMEPDLPYLLRPRYISEEHRRKLENEAKSWLQIQTLKTAIEIKAGISHCSSLYFTLISLSALVIREDDNDDKK